MNKKSVIIIGAGIAGLSAGCYAQMNGYKSQIFEMHDLAGGLCTGWERNEFIINGGLHWLVGAGPKLSFNKIWHELGALQGKQVLIPEELMCIEGPNNQKLILYSDIDRLEQHLLEISPEDKDIIADLMKDLRVFCKHDMPVLKAPEMYGAIDGIKLLFTFLPVMKIMNKWREVTIQDFALRFKNPFLREAIPNFWLPQLSMLFLFLTFGWTNMKAAGYPLGGPYYFAKAIENRYYDLGGKIKFNSKVAKIIVQNDRAVGVRLADGSEYFADYIISAADGHSTIFEMVDQKYVSNEIRNYFDTLHPFPPPIHVALGVKKTFDDITQRILGINFPLAEPITVANEKVDHLTALIYNFDSSTAPQDHTLIECMIHSDYNVWVELGKDPERYKKEKEAIAAQVISALDKRFPGIAANIVMQDVATPLTFNRYTGIWQAGYEGWMITPDTYQIKIRKILPGLKNFHMIGHWVEMGGGLPAAALSGRNLIQIFCKKDRKKFNVTIPS
jgi:phytoene dehydrogenase-like protein